MIKGTFRFGGDIVEVVVDKNNLLFHDTHSQMTTSLEGLKLSKAGVLKEFPDLKDNKEWKKIAIDRLKNHIKNIESEINKLEYVKKELKKHGYEPLYYQRGGHRPKKWNKDYGTG
ncbi:MAG: hypothetical protein ACOC3V_01340 [bacterium]